MKRIVTTETVICDLCKGKIDPNQCGSEHGTITLHVEGKDMMGNGAGAYLLRNSDICESCIAVIRELIKR